MGILNRLMAFLRQETAADVGLDSNTQPPFRDRASALLKLWEEKLEDIWRQWISKPYVTLSRDK